MADDTREPTRIPESAFEATVSLTDLSSGLKSRIVRAILQELGGPIGSESYNKVTYEKPQDGGYKKVTHEKDAGGFTKNIVPDVPGELTEPE